MSTQKDIDFLKWNYEQCQAGYNYRDQMVNDIFYKMIQCFIFLMGLFTISILVAVPDIRVVKFYFAILGIVGFYSLGSLFIILCCLINCKISLRKQAAYLEKLIKNSYNYPECELNPDSTYDHIISELKFHYNNIWQPSKLGKIQQCTLYGLQTKKTRRVKDHIGYIIKLLLCTVFSIILCIVSSLREIVVSNLKPDTNLEICSHWECINNRGGFKSEYDEEASIIQVTGILLIIFWITCCMYIYFHPYIVIEYLIPFSL